MATADTYRNLLACQERIKRANRNVLQVSAAIAGVWGIIGGSDGILGIAQAQVAQADKELPTLVQMYFDQSVLLGVVLSVPLALALARSLLSRWASEREWHRNLERVTDEELLKGLLKLTE